MPVGYGPLWRIDGPSPQSPTYTLLGAARVIDDAEDGVERWGNGVEVYSYPPDLAEIHDACSSGSSRDKVSGGTIPHPQYGAMTVYLAETCSSFGIFGAGMTNEQAQARFVARANAAYGAVESAAIERELLTGEVLGLNPHLVDGNGTFPTVDVAQTVIEGFALLEREIAKSGRRGLIHCSPSMATAAGSHRLLHRDDRTSSLCTINYTTVVPGYGYQDATVHPVGHAAASGRQEWMYATGPVEVRRSELLVAPGELFQALDRAANTITYRAERYYLVDYDTHVQASVLVDRSL